MTGAPMPAEFLLVGAEATFEWGRQLGEHLRPGDGLGLCGELGAGKTTLARGVAAGMGVDDPDAVQSPTYLLVVEHPGRVPMVHVDAYLPEKLRGFLLDGGVDYLGEREGVLVAEWADRVADLMPERTLWIRLEPAREGGREARRAVLTGPERAFGWVARLPRRLGGP